VAHSYASFTKTVDAFDLYTAQNQNVHCAVSSNDQYRGNGFAVEALVGCNHTSFVPFGPTRGVGVL